MSFNRATLLGNVGQDPEIRSTQDGRRIATFSLATSESWKDRHTGERKESTEWHRIVVFNEGLVENVVEKYVRKGSKLLIEGQIRTRKWTDQQGVDRYTTEVVLSAYNGTLKLEGDPKGNRPPPAESPDAYGSSSGSTGAGLPYSARRDHPSAAAEAARRSDLNDDIPFLSGDLEHDVILASNRKPRRAAA